MFSMDDFDKVTDKSADRTSPDYFVSNNEFVDKLMIITNLIKNTDFSDEDSRTHFSMHLMNISFGKVISTSDEKASDVIIALALHLSTIFDAMSESKDAYLNDFDNKIMLPIISQRDVLWIKDDD